MIEKNCSYFFRKLSKPFFVKSGQIQLLLKLKSGTSLIWMATFLHWQLTAFKQLHLTIALRQLCTFPIQSVI